MKLLLIRHGESEADILRVCEGRADFPLTERGERQARAMAGYVAAHYELSAIYCSTLTRARQTAQKLSEATGVPLTPDERLMEFNNGLRAGLPYAEAYEKYPNVPDLPPHCSVYEQESVYEFRFRTKCMLSELLCSADDDQTIAAVAHGGTINAMLRAFTEIPDCADIGFSTGDTGIHELHIDNGKRRVVMLNYTDHTAGI